MSKTWILIANSSKARLYEAQKPRIFKINGHDEQNLNLLKSFTHEQSRKKGSELVSDGPGSYQVGSAGHGSFEAASTPKELEADRFAKELAEELEQGRCENKYDDIIIVANPHFKGLLNKHLKHHLSKYVSRSIEKDYTYMKGRELVSQLREHL